jgi:hypothetical protein
MGDRNGHYRRQKFRRSLSRQAEVSLRCRKILLGLRIPSISDEP